MSENVKSVEECLKRLEEILAALSSQSTDLSESLNLYAEGTRLAQLCRQQLAAAELFVEEHSIQTESDH